MKRKKKKEKKNERKGNVTLSYKETLTYFSKLTSKIIKLRMYEIPVSTAAQSAPSKEVSSFLQKKKVHSSILYTLLVWADT